MNRILVLVGTLVIFLGLSSAASADDPINTGFFNNRAIHGYDPVAYFTVGKPVKGEKAHQYDFMGAEWRFSSAENLKLFKADPFKYAPQYGGYCSWAAGRGYLANGDPETWRIVDGKLYLNYDTSIQVKWEKDILGFIAKANVNYPDLVDLETVE